MAPTPSVAAGPGAAGGADLIPTWSSPSPPYISATGQDSTKCINSTPRVLEGAHHAGDVLSVPHRRLRVGVLIPGPPETEQDSFSGNGNVKDGCAHLKGS